MSIVERKNSQSPSLRRALTGMGRGNGIHPSSKFRTDEESQVGVDGDITPGAPRSTHVTLNSKLAIFRVMTGINTGSELTVLEGINRPVSNVGIYTQVVKFEKQAGREYSFFRLLINTCLGIQLIFAAALTALSAGNGPRGLMTAFGAINTIIAGFLTYLKGSGLPNRKRYYLNEWGKVRQYIEQREREFCLEPCNLDVEEEVSNVEMLFQEVKGDIEANTPESYASNSSPQGKQTTPAHSSSAATRRVDDCEGSPPGSRRDGTRRSMVRVPEKVDERNPQPS